MADLLVVAGEASGDRAAAAVVARLSGVHAFGLGGPALAAAGCRLVGDLRRSTALGVGEVAWRALGILRSWRAVLRAAKARRPAAALLVDYTEYNARLAKRLHAAGVRVLWYGAPQVWAWRPRRVHAIGKRIDRLAVMLPFEEALWREAGVDASYVGHPALETRTLDRASARRELGLTPFADAVAILPGSRPHEVRRLLVPMLGAYERVRAHRASVDARVLLAASLDDPARSWARDRCAERRIPTALVGAQAGAMALLKAFDVALCASGTVTLEAAIAGVPPVITYRVGLATELTARAFVQTPHIGLPNVLLGRRAFPELVQRRARADHLAEALADALDERAELGAACRAVAEALGGARTPSAEVAGMLAPWLGARVL